MFTRPNTADGYRDFIADWSRYDEVKNGDPVVSVAPPASIPAGLLFGVPVVASPKSTVPICTKDVKAGTYAVRLVATLASGKTITMTTPTLGVTE